MDSNIQVIFNKYLPVLVEHSKLQLVEYNNRLIMNRLQSTIMENRNIVDNWITYQMYGYIKHCKWIVEIKLYHNFFSFAAMMQPHFVNSFSIN